ncbi:MAG TPA: hypothetical protein VFF67_06285 [Thermoplasmata archaeon]|nr:hypothetical protein [Thermoplasmata archaeon]
MTTGFRARRTGTELRPNFRRAGRNCAAIAGVALLVLIAPLAVGASAPTVLRAPYKHTTVSYGSGYTYSGCARASIPRSPYWLPTTGLAGFSERAVANACPPLLGGIGSDSVGSYTASFDPNVPIHFTTNGGHVVTVNWSLTVAVRTAASITGTCPLAQPVKVGQYSYSDCYAATLIDLGVFANLHDITNGSYVYSTMNWYGMYNYSVQYNDSSCSGAACNYYNNSYGSFVNFTGTIGSAWVFNASGYQSINASHKYEIRMSLNGWGYAELFGYPYGYSAARLTSFINAGTLGNGWTLTSITIT